MTSIDELLARHRLIHEPYTRADLDAAAERVAARAARPYADTLARHGGAAPAPQCGQEVSAAAEAAEDLHVLCETVVARPDALDHLRSFLTHSLPEPPGARVLGCLLHLAGCEDPARFWWQYAAGADDPVAGYCLYLHHLALGEDGEAHWWRAHTDVTPAPMDNRTTEVEIILALRILRLLKEGNFAVPAPISTLLTYVPVAVGYVGDFDLPLPDADFPDRVHALTIATDPAHPGRPPDAHLPARTPGRYVHATPEERRKEMTPHAALQRRAARDLQRVEAMDAVMI